MVIDTIEMKTDNFYKKIFCVTNYSGEPKEMEKAVENRKNDEKYIRDEIYLDLLKNLYFNGKGNVFGQNSKYYTDKYNNLDKCLIKEIYIKSLKKNEYNNKDSCYMFDEKTGFLEKVFSNIDLSKFDDITEDTVKKIKKTDEEIRSIVKRDEHGNIIGFDAFDRKSFLNNDKKKEDPRFFTLKEIYRIKKEKQKEEEENFDEKLLKILTGKEKEIFNFNERYFLDFDKKEKVTGNFFYYRNRCTGDNNNYPNYRAIYKNMHDNDDYDVFSFDYKKNKEACVYDIEEQTSDNIKTIIDADNNITYNSNDNKYYISNIKKADIEYKNRQDGKFFLKYRGPIKEKNKKGNGIGVYITNSLDKLKNKVMKERQKKEEEDNLSKITEDDNSSKIIRDFTSNAETMFEDIIVKSDNNNYKITTEEQDDLRVNRENIIFYIKGFFKDDEINFDEEKKNIVNTDEGEKNIDEEKKNIVNIECNIKLECKIKQKKGEKQKKEPEEKKFGRIVYLIPDSNTKIEGNQTIEKSDISKILCFCIYVNNGIIYFNKYKYKNEENKFISVGNFKISFSELGIHSKGIIDKAFYYGLKNNYDFFGFLDHPQVKEDQKSSVYDTSSMKSGNTSKIYDFSNTSLINLNKTLNNEGYRDLDESVNDILNESNISLSSLLNRPKNERHRHYNEGSGFWFEDEFTFIEDKKGNKIEKRLKSRYVYKDKESEEKEYEISYFYDNENALLQEIKVENGEGKLKRYLKFCKKGYYYENFEKEFKKEKDFDKTYLQSNLLGDTTELSYMADILCYDDDKIEGFYLAKSNNEIIKREGSFATQYHRNDYEHDLEYYYNCYAGIISLDLKLKEVEEKSCKKSKIINEKSKKTQEGQFNKEIQEEQFNEEIQEGSFSEDKMCGNCLVKYIPKKEKQDFSVKSRKGWFDNDLMKGDDCEIIFNNGCVFTGSVKDDKITEGKLRLPEDYNNKDKDNMNVFYKKNNIELKANDEVFSDHWVLCKGNDNNKDKDKNNIELKASDEVSSLEESFPKIGYRIDNTDGNTFFVKRKSNDENSYEIIIYGCHTTNKTKLKFSSVEKFKIEKKSFDDIVKQSNNEADEIIKNIQKTCLLKSCSLLYEEKAEDNNDDKFLENIKEYVSNYEEAVEEIKDRYKNTDDNSIFSVGMYFSCDAKETKDEKDKKTKETKETKDEKEKETKDEKYFYLNENFNKKNKIRKEFFKKNISLDQLGMSNFNCDTGAGDSDTAINFYNKDNGFLEKIFTSINSSINSSYYRKSSFLEREDVKNFIPEGMFDNFSEGWKLLKSSIFAMKNEKIKNSTTGDIFRKKDNEIMYFAGEFDYHDDNNNDNNDNNISAEEEIALIESEDIKKKRKEYNNYCNDENFLPKPESCKLFCLFYNNGNYYIGKPSTDFKPCGEGEFFIKDLGENINCCSSINNSKELRKHFDKIEELKDGVLKNGDSIEGKFTKEGTLDDKKNFVIKRDKKIIRVLQESNDKKIIIEEYDDDFVDLKKEIKSITVYSMSEGLLYKLILGEEGKEITEPYKEYISNLYFTEDGKNNDYSSSKNKNKKISTLILFGENIVSKKYNKKGKLCEKIDHCNNNGEMTDKSSKTEIYYNEVNGQSIPSKVRVFDKNNDLTKIQEYSYKESENNNINSINEEIICNDEIDDNKNILIKFSAKRIEKKDDKSNKVFFEGKKIFDNGELYDGTFTFLKKEDREDIFYEYNGLIHLKNGQLLRSSDDNLGIGIYKSYNKGKRELNFTKISNNINTDRFATINKSIDNEKDDGKEEKISIGNDLYLVGSLREFSPDEEITIKDKDDDIVYKGQLDRNYKYYGKGILHKKDENIKIEAFFSCSKYESSYVKITKIHNLKPAKILNFGGIDFDSFEGFLDKENNPIEGEFCCKKKGEKTIYKIEDGKISVSTIIKCDEEEHLNDDVSKKVDKEITRKYYLSGEQTCTVGVKIKGYCKNVKIEENNNTINKKFTFDVRQQKFVLSKIAKPEEQHKTTTEKINDDSELICYYNKTANNNKQKYYLDRIEVKEGSTKRIFYYKQPNNYFYDEEKKISYDFFSRKVKKDAYKWDTETYYGGHLYSKEEYRKGDKQRYIYYYEYNNLADEDVVFEKITKTASANNEIESECHYKNYVFNVNKKPYKKVSFDKNVTKTETMKNNGEIEIKEQKQGKEGSLNTTITKIIDNNNKILRIREEEGQKFICDENKLARITRKTKENDYINNTIIETEEIRTMDKLTINTTTKKQDGSIKEFLYEEFDSNGQNLIYTKKETHLENGDSEIEETKYKGNCVECETKKYTNFNGKDKCYEQKKVIKLLSGREVKIYEKKDGEEKFFYYSGTTKQKKTYGQYDIYCENNPQIDETYYPNGNPQKMIEYDDKGKKNKIIYYSEEESSKEEKVINFSEKEGELTKSIKYPVTKTEYIITYNNNKKATSIKKIINGHTVKSIENSYDESGLLSKQTIYYGDDVETRFIEYDKNGKKQKIKIMLNKKNDDKNIIHDSDVIYSKGRISKRIFYNKANKKVSKEWKYEYKENGEIIIHKNNVTYQKYHTTKLEIFDRQYGFDFKINKISSGENKISTGEDNFSTGEDNFLKFTRKESEDGGQMILFYDKSNKDLLAEVALDGSKARYHYKDKIIEYINEDRGVDVHSEEINYYTKDNKKKFTQINDDFYGFARKWYDDNGELKNEEYYNENGTLEHSYDGKIIKEYKKEKNEICYKHEDPNSNKIIKEITCWNNGDIKKYNCNDIYVDFEKEIKIEKKNDGKDIIYTKIHCDENFDKKNTNPKDDDIKNLKGICFFSKKFSKEEDYLCNTEELFSVNKKSNKKFKERKFLDENNMHLEIIYNPDGDVISKKEYDNNKNIKFKIKNKNGVRHEYRYVYCKDNKNKIDYIDHLNGSEESKKKFEYNKDGSISKIVEKDFNNKKISEKTYHYNNGKLEKIEKEIFSPSRKEYSYLYQDEIDDNNTHYTKITKITKIDKNGDTLSIKKTDSEGNTFYKEKNEIEKEFIYPEYILDKKKSKKETKKIEGDINVKITKEINHDGYEKTTTIKKKGDLVLYYSIKNAFGEIEKEVYYEYNEDGILENEHIFSLNTNESTKEGFPFIYKKINYFISPGGEKTKDFETKLAKKNDNNNNEYIINDDTYGKANIAIQKIEGTKFCYIACVEQDGNGELLGNKLHVVPYDEKFLYLNDYQKEIEGMKELKPIFTIDIKNGINTEYMNHKPFKDNEDNLYGDSIIFKKGDDNNYKKYRVYGDNKDLVEQKEIDEDGVTHLKKYKYNFGNKCYYLYEYSYDKDGKIISYKCTDHKDDFEDELVEEIVRDDEKKQEFIYKKYNNVINKKLLVPGILLYEARFKNGIDFNTINEINEHGEDDVGRYLRSYYEDNIIYKIYHDYHDIICNKEKSELTKRTEEGVNIDEEEEGDRIIRTEENKEKKTKKISAYLKKKKDKKIFEVSEFPSKDKKSYYPEGCCKILKIFDDSKDDDKQYLKKIIYYGENDRIIKIEEYFDDCVFEDGKEIEDVKDKRSFCEEFCYSDDDQLKKYKQTKYKKTSENNNNVEYHYEVTLHDKSIYSKIDAIDLVDPYIESVLFYTTDNKKRSFYYNTKICEITKEEIYDRNAKIDVFDCGCTFNEKTKDFVYEPKMDTIVGKLTYKSSSNIFTLEDDIFYKYDKKLRNRKWSNLTKELEVFEFFKEKTEYDHDVLGELKEKVTYNNDKDKDKSNITCYEYKKTKQKNVLILKKKTSSSSEGNEENKIFNNHEIDKSKYKNNIEINLLKTNLIEKEPGCMAINEDDIGYTKIKSGEEDTIEEISSEKAPYEDKVTRKKTLLKKQLNEQESCQASEEETFNEEFFNYEELDEDVVDEKKEDDYLDKKIKSGYYSLFLEKKSKEKDIDIDEEYTGNCNIEYSSNAKGGYKEKYKGTLLHGEKVEGSGYEKHEQDDKITEGVVFFEGSYRNNKRYNGKINIFIGNKRYVGEVKKGKFSDEAGEIYFSDSKNNKFCYKGSVKDGKMDGKGEINLTMPDGKQKQVFKGTFKDDFILEGKCDSYPIQNGKYVKGEVENHNFYGKEFFDPSLHKQACKGLVRYDTRGWKRCGYFEELDSDGKKTGGYFYIDGNIKHGKEYDIYGNKIFDGEFKNNKPDKGIRSITDNGRIISSFKISGGKRVNDNKEDYNNKKTKNDDIDNSALRIKKIIEQGRIIDKSKNFDEKGFNEKFDSKNNKSYYFNNKQELVCIREYKDNGKKSFKETLFFTADELIDFDKEFKGFDFKGKREKIKYHDNSSKKDTEYRLIAKCKRNYDDNGDLCGEYIEYFPNGEERLHINKKKVLEKIGMLFSDRKAKTKDIKDFVIDSNIKDGDIEVNDRYKIISGEILSFKGNGDGKLYVTEISNGNINGKFSDNFQIEGIYNCGYSFLIKHNKEGYYVFVDFDHDDCKICRYYILDKNLNLEQEFNFFDDNEEDQKNINDKNADNDEKLTREKGEEKFKEHEENLKKISAYENFGGKQKNYKDCHEDYKLLEDLFSNHIKIEDLNNQRNNLDKQENEKNYDHNISVLQLVIKILSNSLIVEGVQNNKKQQEYDENDVRLFHEAKQIIEKEIRNDETFFKKFKNFFKDKKNQLENLLQTTVVTNGAQAVGNILPIPLIGWISSFVAGKIVNATQDQRTEVEKTLSSKIDTVKEKVKALKNEKKQLEDNKKNNEKELNEAEKEQRNLFKKVDTQVKNYFQKFNKQNKEDIFTEEEIKNIIDGLKRNPKYLDEKRNELEGYNNDYENERDKEYFIEKERKRLERLRENKKNYKKKFLKNYFTSNERLKRDKKFYDQLDGIISSHVKYGKDDDNARFIEEATKYNICRDIGQDDRDKINQDSLDYDKYYCFKNSYIDKEFKTEKFFDAKNINFLEPQQCIHPHIIVNNNNNKFKYSNIKRQAVSIYNEAGMPICLDCEYIKNPNCNDPSSEDYYKFEGKGIKCFNKKMRYTDKAKKEVKQAKEEKEEKEDYFSYIEFDGIFRDGKESEGTMYYEPEGLTSDDPRYEIETMENKTKKIKPIKGKKKISCRLNKNNIQEGVFFDKEEGVIFEGKFNKWKPYEGEAIKLLYDDILFTGTIRDGKPYEGYGEKTNNKEKDTDTIKNEKNGEKTNNKEKDTDTIKNEKNKKKTNEKEFFLYEKGASRKVKEKEIKNYNNEKKKINNKSILSKLTINKNKSSNNDNIIIDNNENEEYNDNLKFNGFDSKGCTFSYNNKKENRIFSYEKESFDLKSIDYSNAKILFFKRKDDNIFYFTYKNSLDSQKKIGTTTIDGAYLCYDLPLFSFKKYDNEKYDNKKDEQKKEDKQKKDNDNNNETITEYFDFNFNFSKIKSDVKRVTEYCNDPPKKAKEEKDKKAKEAKEAKETEDKKEKEKKEENKIEEGKDEKAKEHKYFKDSKNNFFSSKKTKLYDENNEIFYEKEESYEKTYEKFTDNGVIKKTEKWYKKAPLDLEEKRKNTYLFLNEENKKMFKYSAITDDDIIVFSEYTYDEKNKKNNILTKKSIAIRVKHGRSIFFDIKINTILQDIVKNKNKIELNTVIDEIRNKNLDEYIDGLYKKKAISILDKNYNPIFKLEEHFPVEIEKSIKNNYNRSDNDSGLLETHYSYDKNHCLIGKSCFDSEKKMDHIFGIGQIDKDEINKNTVVRKGKFEGLREENGEEIINSNDKVIFENDKLKKGHIKSILKIGKDTYYKGDVENFVPHGKGCKYIKKEYTNKLGIKKEKFVLYEDGDFCHGELNDGKRYKETKEDEHSFKEIIIKNKKEQKDKNKSNIFNIKQYDKYFDEIYEGQAKVENGRIEHTGVGRTIDKKGKKKKLEIKNIRNKTNEILNVSDLQRIPSVDEKDNRNINFYKINIDIYNDMISDANKVNLNNINNINNINISNDMNQQKDGKEEKEREELEKAILYESKGESMEDALIKDIKHIEIEGNYNFTAEANNFFIDYKIPNAGNTCFLNVAFRLFNNNYKYFHLLEKWCKQMTRDLSFNEKDGYDYYTAVRDKVLDDDTKNSHWKRFFATLYKLSKNKNPENYSLMNRLRNSFNKLTNYQYINKLDKNNPFAEGDCNEVLQEIRKQFEIHVLSVDKNKKFEEDFHLTEEPEIVPDGYNVVLNLNLNGDVIENSYSGNKTIEVQPIASNGIACSNLGFKFRCLSSNDEEGVHLHAEFMPCFNDVIYLNNITGQEIEVPKKNSKTNGIIIPSYETKIKDIREIVINGNTYRLFGFAHFDYNKNHYVYKGYNSSCGKFTIYDDTKPKEKEEIDLEKKIGDGFVTSCIFVKTGNIGNFKFDTEIPKKEEILKKVNDKFKLIKDYLSERLKFDERLRIFNFIKILQMVRDDFYNGDLDTLKKYAENQKIDKNNIFFDILDNISSFEKKDILFCKEGEKEEKIIGNSENKYKFSLSKRKSLLEIKKLLIAIFEQKIDSNNNIEENKKIIRKTINSLYNINFEITAKENLLLGKEEKKEIKNSFQNSYNESMQNIYNLLGLKLDLSSNQKTKSDEGINIFLVRDDNPDNPIFYNDDQNNFKINIKHFIKKNKKGLISTEGFDKDKFQKEIEEFFSKRGVFTLGTQHINIIDCLKTYEDKNDKSYIDEKQNVQYSTSAIECINTCFKYLSSEKIILGTSFGAEKRSGGSHNYVTEIVKQISNNKNIKFLEINKSLPKDGSNGGSMFNYDLSKNKFEFKKEGKINDDDDVLKRITYTREKDEQLKQKEEKNIKYGEQFPEKIRRKMREIDNSSPSTNLKEINLKEFNGSGLGIGGDSDSDFEVIDKYE